MKILVTGAAGFIGFYLSKKLLDKGHTVIGVDNINDYYDVNLKYARLKELGISRAQATMFNEACSSDVYETFQFIRLNLEDKQELSLLFKAEKFDVVCNLAAQAGVRYSIENPDAYIQSNIVGFLNILECCRHNNIQHLLYASSSSVYGANKKVPFETSDNVDNPISLYAATKKSNELMAHTYSHLYKIPTTGLRFFTVYGPLGRPDMAPMLFANAIKNEKAIKVFNNGDMSRDFTYIDDIVNGIQILIEDKVKSSQLYNLYNIGNGKPESLMFFIETIEKCYGKIADKEFLPMQPGDVPQTWASTKSLEKLGYKSSTDMTEGIDLFIKWFKEYYK